MAYRVVLYPDEAFGRIELNGVVTSQQIAEAVHGVFGHEAWPGYGDCLWDCMGITSLLIEPEGLAHIADWKAVYLEERARGKSAALVSRDDQAEMAVLIGRYREKSGRILKVVRSMEDALDFLGLDTLPPSERGMVTASSWEGAVK